MGSEGGVGDRPIAIGIGSYGEEKEQYEKQSGKDSGIIKDGRYFSFLSFPYIYIYIDRSTACYKPHLESHSLYSIIKKLTVEMITQRPICCAVFSESGPLMFSRSRVQSQLMYLI